MGPTQIYFPHATVPRSFNFLEKAIQWFQLCSFSWRLFFRVAAFFLSCGFFFELRRKFQSQWIAALFSSSGWIQVWVSHGVTRFIGQYCNHSQMVDNYNKKHVGYITIIKKIQVIQVSQLAMFHPHQQRPTSRRHVRMAWWMVPVGPSPHPGSLTSWESVFHRSAVFCPVKTRRLIVIMYVVII